MFTSGSTELRVESLVFLQEVASLINGTPDTVAIEGHTDSSPSSSTTNNWQISTSRAVATLEFLVDVARVDPARLQVTGFADTRPIASNEDAEGRARNRRVEFTFLHNQEPTGG